MDHQLDNEDPDPFQEELEQETEVKQEDDDLPEPAQTTAEEDDVGDEEPGERADEDEEEDEDEDEDDVQINIGDYKPGSLSLTPAPININIKKGPAAGTTKKVVAVDLNAEGTYNGESIYDLNLDTIEEKPWTKPGADITDYFNYGFTEENWKLYCLKQRKLRMELTDEGMYGSGGPSQKPGRDFAPRSVDSIVNENSKYSGQQLKQIGAGPPPGRKPSGAIDVIGTQSGGIPSRRPVDQNEFDSNPNKIQVLSRPPPLGPPPFNMNMPPPHLMHGMDGGFIPRVPPPGMMPPNGQPMPYPHPDFHSGPPPRFMPPPPPNQMLNESPRGYNDDFDDGPDDGRDRDFGYPRGGQHWPRGAYERGRECYRDREEGDYRRGAPHHPYDRRELDQREFELREYNEQMERNSRSERDDRSESKDQHETSSRSRSHRDRDRDRDHDSKSREKDNERDKDRSESSSSSSKRRHHDDESKSSSSRHKHSKRSRRDKDEDSKH